MTTDEDLELIFSRFGPIKCCEIIRDQKTGDSLNYAFIEFETEDACLEAYEKMNNVLIDDRRIKVDFSQSVSKLWNRFLLRPRNNNKKNVDTANPVISNVPQHGGNKIQNNNNNNKNYRNSNNNNNNSNNHNDDRKGHIDHNKNASNISKSSKSSNIILKSNNNPSKYDFEFDRGERHDERSKDRDRDRDRHGERGDKYRDRSYRETDRDVPTRDRGENPSRHRADEGRQPPRKRSRSRSRSRDRHVASGGGTTSKRR